MFYDYLFPTVVLKDYNVLKNPQKILGAIGTERHSTPHIHKEEKFKELADKVLEYSNDYAKNMKWNTELYIVSMWYNSMKQHEDHRPHSHGNSLLSGVYYPTGTPSHPSIEFFDKRGVGIIDPTLAKEGGDSSAFTIENSTSWHYPVIPNSILIFPSWLQHWVSVNKCEIPRISISFNIMIKGQAGKEEDLNGIIWK